MADSHRLGVRIDTTPTTPRPPQLFIAAAEREIPNVLANIKPQQDGIIEMIASLLAKRLQDAGHTLAAAQWGVHEAVLARRLQPGLIEVDSPSVGRVVGGTMRHWGGVDNRHLQWSGGKQGTIGLPKDKPAPFDKFKVAATAALWEWWQVQHAPQPSEPVRVEPAELSPIAPTVKAPTKAKRSTARGEGRLKLIAALTKHHQYADGGCLNLEPIGNNKLAELAGVSESTASAFFDKEFKGHAKYRANCMDPAGLVASLKLLNQGYSPHHLFGAKPPDEGYGDDEE